MTDLTKITEEKITEIFKAFLDFLPSLAGALIVLIIGWIIAIFIGKIVSGILYRLRFNEPFKNEKWIDAMKEANININPSEFLGKISKWLLFIIAIWIAVTVLGLNQVADFVGNIIAYIPDVIAAIIILIIAVMIGEGLSKLIIAATEKSDFPYSKMSGTIVKVSIWIFAAFAILVQLGIAEELLVILFTGLIIFLALAGGLAFGLGGKDAASKIIEDIKKNSKK